LKLSGSYNAKSFIYPIDSGGISFAPNEFETEANLLGEESINVDIGREMLSSRAGTKKFFENGFGSSIVAIVSYKGNVFIACSSGEIYKNEELSTTQSPSEHGCFAASRGYLFFANGVDLPIAYNDTEWVDVTPPADWVEGNMPKYVYAQPIGASTQLWAFGLPSKTTCNMIYAPSPTDPLDFSDDLDKVWILPLGKVGEPIVGMAAYGEALLVFSQTQAYIVDITSTSRSEWFYKPANWRGGATNHETIIAAVNDVVVFNKTLFYSIAAVQTVAEYKIGSISDKARIDLFLQSNVPFAARDKGFALFNEIDNTLWFVFEGTRDGVAVTYVLVFYPTLGSWTLFVGLNNLRCGCWHDTPFDDRVLLIGCADGYVRRIAPDERSDDGEVFQTIIATRHLQVDSRVLNKHFLQLELAVSKYAAAGTHIIKFWKDGLYIAEDIFTVPPMGFILDISKLDIDKLSDGKVFRLISKYLSFVGNLVKFIFEVATVGISIVGLAIHFIPQGLTSGMSTETQASEDKGDE